ncbi:hypothetical protein M0R45_001050 [Rubus argutus]|uniref:Uncharacterized protein n=1 Tax=Rubus argutus TaxID=59490 RepID=A0AAW1VMP2_RUBAR
MKRGMPWSDEDDSSSDESFEEKKTGQPSKKTASQVKSGKPGEQYHKVKIGTKEKEGEEESKEERQKMRDALATGEQLEYAQTRKKNLSFSQKEKRKRDLGQASREKNYVEEEKRLLRENGVYSGFDS